MTTVAHTPIEERKLIQKPFITDLDGHPAMPPEDYWEFWRNEMPAFKMGTPQRPTGPTSGQLRVLRGGSWFNNPGSVRVSSRSWYQDGDKGVVVGFRCAGEVSGP